MDADDIVKEVKIRRDLGPTLFDRDCCPRCFRLVISHRTDDDDHYVSWKDCSHCSRLWWENYVKWAESEEGKKVLDKEDAERKKREKELAKVCAYCLKPNALRGMKWCSDCRDRQQRKTLIPIAEKVRNRVQLAEDEKLILRIAEGWPIWEKEFKGLEQIERLKPKSSKRVKATSKWPSPKLKFEKGERG